MDQQTIPSEGSVSAGTPAPGGFCSNCGSPLNAGVAVCPNCGAPTGAGVPAAPTSTPVPPTSTPVPPTDAPAGAPAAPADAPAGAPANPVANALAGSPIPDQVKKLLANKTVLIAAAAAVVVILLAILIIPRVLGGGSSSSNYALYLKDSEIVYTDFSKDGAREITTKLFNGDSPSNYSQSQQGYQLGYVITVSQDGKTIFYPDRSSSSMVLYCRSLAKPKEDPTKLDSDISSYTVNKAANRVTYLKEDGGLYQHDLKDKNKIAADVSAFYAAEDGSKVLYRTNEDALYLWTAKSGEKEKLVSDISSLQKVSDDLSTVYYIKEGNLYKQAASAGGEKEKLASDVYSVVAIYDSGELYYIKSEDLELHLSDYVTDDMAAHDANLKSPDDVVWPEYPTPPEKPSYPSYWSYSTWDEYNAAVDEYNSVTLPQYNADYAAWESGPKAQYYKDYEQAQQEYNDAWTAQYEKNNRDDLRSYLENATMTQTQYSLYYYDGKGDSLITSSMSGGYVSSYSSDAAVAVIRMYDSDDVPTTKISEIYSYYDVQSKVQSALYDKRSYAIVAGGSLTQLEGEAPGSFTVASDGSAVYYLDDWSSSGSSAELYKVSISKGTVGKSEVYDSDVSANIIRPTKSGSVLYFKDVSGSTGDLYMDKSIVDYDVYTGTISVADKDVVYYYTEWSTSNECGTLKYSKSGTKTKVADDVRTFYLLGSDSLLYLDDFSNSSYKGTLSLYKNGKSQKLADDVSAIIPIIKSSMRYVW